MDIQKIIKDANEDLALQLSLGSDSSFKTIREKASAAIYFGCFYQGAKFEPRRIITTFQESGHEYELESEKWWEGSIGSFSIRFDGKQWGQGWI
jgi:hypothetical protein